MTTPALQFRPATHADTDAVIALVESAYRGDASRAGWTTEADFLDGRRTGEDDIAACIDRERSLILLGGIVTRPGGGLVLRRHPDATRRLVAASLGLGAVAVVVIAADPPLWLATTAAAVAGLAAGFPFAAVMAGAQRARPDAPAAAVGLTNGVAVLVIVVATPLAGLGFDLPGEGDLVFVTLAALWGTALLAVRRAPL